MNSSVFPAYVMCDEDNTLGLETESLFSILGEKGVIVFRDCFESVDSFSSFVKKHSSKLSLDPGRTIKGGVAQLVDAGTDPVGLHCENGNAPIWPDLTWFYCQRAPLAGSQTTLCDGQLVLADLSPGLVETLREKQIRYRRTVPGDKWRRIVCHYKSTIKSINDVSFGDLQSIVASDPGASVIYNEVDDSVSYAFTVSAIQRSTFNDREAFANSILGPSFNYEIPVIDFATGEDFDIGMLDEIEDITARHTHIVGWKDGDVVMIDNRRVMHGRDRIVDPDRKIFNALSYR